MSTEYRRIMTSVMDLGRFLINEYDEDRTVNMVRFLTDVLDLCQRFGVDFDEALGLAREAINVRREGIS